MHQAQIDVFSSVLPVGPKNLDEIGQELFHILLTIEFEACLD